MFNRITIRSFVWALVWVSLFSAFLHAEDAPSRRKELPPIVQKLNEKLSQMDLSGDQRTKIDQIISDTAAQVIKIRQANNDNPEAREQLGQLFGEVRTKLAGVLNTEQIKQLQESMPKRFNGDNPPPMMEMNDQKKIQAPDRSPATQPEEKLKVGQSASDFKLKNPSGKVFTLNSFKNKPTLFLFGSFSSPTFRSRVTNFEDLRRDYIGKINVVIIYTREAYPANEWEVQRNVDDQVKVNQPATIEDRTKLAQQTRDSAKFAMEILVDDMDDAVTTAYDGFPNACVLIDGSGNIIMKQKWADAWGVRNYLDSTLKAH